MDKNSALKKVRKKIEQGKVKTIREVFEIIPFDDLAKDLHLTPARIRKCKMHIQNWYVIELVALADLIGIDPPILFGMLVEDRRQRPLEGKL